MPMKILLFGNPSMYQSNLAQGLRTLGHEVTLVSRRYGWRKFSGHDVLLERRHDINSKLAFLLYLWDVIRLLPTWRSYDIVQLSHCGFLELRGKHTMPFYRLLRRWNKRLVMCCCDVDYHVLDQIENHAALRYSELQIGSTKQINENADELRKEFAPGGWWVDYSRYVSADCDAIVPVLFEYWTCYERVYPEKNRFIPLPVIIDEKHSTKGTDSSGLLDGVADMKERFAVGDKVKIFIGLQRDRMHIKGIDILLQAAEDIARDYPDLCNLSVVENVPYAEYERIMNDSDVLIDQLYSYTPAMNALVAMSKGIVVVGGGEPENYEILDEAELRPIVNVLPNYDSCYNELKELVLHKERIPELKRQSVEYVRKHHDHLKVARQYEALYTELLASGKNA